MRLILAIAAVLLFATCTKDGKNITVQGRVLNPVTGEGIPNVRIELLRETSGDPGTSGGYKEVETVYSDANGNYELSHTSIFSRLIACYPDNDVYDNLGWAENGALLHSYKEKVNRGKFTYLDYWAVPYASLNQQVQNVNCQSPADEMQIRFKTQFEDDYSYWSPIVYGCYSSNGTTNVPMGWRYYETKVTRSGVINYVYDTVYVGASGVTTVNIDY